MAKNVGFGFSKYCDGYFDKYFESWVEKPFSCKKWANAKLKSSLEFFNSVCIFSDFDKSQAFRQWLINNQ